MFIIQSTGENYEFLFKKKEHLTNCDIDFVSSMFTRKFNSGTYVVML